MTCSSPMEAVMTEGVDMLWLWHMKMPTRCAQAPILLVGSGAWIVALRQERPPVKKVRSKELDRAGGGGGNAAAYEQAK